MAFIFRVLTVGVMTYLLGQSDLWQKAQPVETVTTFHAATIIMLMIIIALLVMNYED